MHEFWPDIIGCYGVGKHNDIGIKLLQLCAINNLFIANTIFKHKDRRRYIWTTQKHTEIQFIDFIIMSNTLKSTLKNCRTYNSSEIWSDQSLVIANLVMKKPTIKPTKYETYNKKTTESYDTVKLQSEEESKKL